jgi:3-hydroxyanthranilate 3,4-dioxygenase
MGKEFVTFTYALAAQSGPYDEASILPETLDIELTLSRNDRPQPFHLICEHDSVLVVMSGQGRIEFKGSSVLHQDYVLGDVVYVPAGTPHRILPSEESIHHRFKLPESQLEGLAWYCEDCGEELHRVVWALADTLPQEGYLNACNHFNSDEELRQCGRCSAKHPKLDLDGYRWERIAQERRDGANA